MPGLEKLYEFELDEERKRVYIAGPYTHGKWGHNQRQAIQAAQAVLVHGHIPFIPHTMTGLWSVMYDNEWIKFDLYWVKMCDALIRLPGKSDGSDTEVEFAINNDIEVHYGVEDFKDNVDKIDGLKI